MNSPSFTEMPGRSSVRTSAAEEQAAQLDQTFTLLQNRRRRLVLEYLRERESTTQSALARHVAAVENGIPEDAVTSTQRKRVYVSLYQAHLPKLDDFGAISFDRDRGTVERTPRVDELLQYLDRFEGRPTEGTTAAAVTAHHGTALLAAALGVVFVGEFGVLPVELYLGVAALLSLVGMGILVYGTRR